MKDLDVKLDEALSALRRVEAIMSAEGEENWIRGIRAAIEAGESTQRGELDAYSEMARIYRGMSQGGGGYGDFCIWREDYEDRQLANREFNLLTERLWVLLGPSALE